MSAKKVIFDEQLLGVMAARQDRAPSPVLKLPGDSLFISEVVDNVAHFGTVKVNSANDGVIIGVPITWSGNGIIGPRKIGRAFPAHTSVVCYKPRGVHFCYVLGSIPDFINSAENNYLPDWIVPASTVGMAGDQVHWGILDGKDGPSGEINFSHGSPLDELPGDVGYINEFGVSYGIGRFMAWLRASHFCGVEAFWLDNLLRLTGYNLEISTAASEMRAFNDEGEWNQISNWGPYPWETLGMLKHSKDFTKKDNAGIKDWRSGRAAREPHADDQAGLWRVKRVRGYLGDLERTVVSLPDRDALEAATASNGPSTDELVEQLSLATKLPGLLDIGFNVDGSYHVSSAKGVLFEKRVTIPVPKEMKLPDDPTGDNNKDYKASGILGEGGDEHKKEEPELPDDNPGLRSLLAYERHALLYNFFGYLSFVKHKKDWLVPDESDAVAALKLDKAIYDSDKDIDDNIFWMPLPKSSIMEVDHRGSTKYYSGRAFMQIDEDGSIVLEDAYGSQIRMEGGNIFISARNDVVLQPGRNVQAWAPHDLILKAGNSADLSCSKGDTRIKAEGNLMMSANTKGVLIESAFDPAKHGSATPDWSELGEDIESRGVLIKALDSDIITMSQDAYFRTGARKSNETGDNDPLRINSKLHLDAGAGQGTLSLNSGNTINRTSDLFQVIVGSTGDNDSTASLDFSKNDFILGGKTLQSFSVGAFRSSFGHEDQDSAQFTVHGNSFVRGSLFTTSSAFIGGFMMINGSATIQNSLQIKGDGLFTGILLAKAVAVDQGGGFLPSTGDDFNAADLDIAGHPEIAKERTDADVERLRSSLQAARINDNAKVTELKDELYGESSKFASPELIDNAVFSFRSPKQYGTDREFVWYESRWQEYNRKLFKKKKTWEEVAILAPGTGDKTMPYPGFSVWEEDKALITLEDNKLFDFSTGASIARSSSNGSGKSIENDSTLAKTKAVTFKGGYVVTLQ